MSKKKFSLLKHIFVKYYYFFATTVLRRNIFVMNLNYNVVSFERELCEPNLNLPQKEAIEQIRENEDKTIFDEGKKMHVFAVSETETDQKEQLKKSLSVKTNLYLNCKWNIFLKKANKNTPNIKLYGDISTKS